MSEVDEHPHSFKHHRQKNIRFGAEGNETFTWKLPWNFVHFAYALVRLISDIIAPICAEQSEREPFWVAALDGLSFSRGLRS